jgi:high-affinity Fe2+/Pb2+ permease
MWRQIVSIVWRVEKENWRDAAVIGLVGAVIGAAAAGTLGYLLFGWVGLLAGAAGGFVLGWLLLVLILQSASLFH